MLDAGMWETDLMAVAGWRAAIWSPRCAAETPDTRAIKAARALSPGDRMEPGR